MHIMCDLLCLFRPVRSGVSALDIFIVMKMIFTHVHSLILVLLQIVDSPGLCDTKLSDQETSVIIVKTVVGLHPGPHALLYVVKTERFTDEEYQVFKKLESLFNKNIYNYLVVIFTGGDNFEHDGLSPVQAIEQAPPTLKQLLKDCKQRYVVFNNRAAKPRPQVKELLEIVRAMVKENGDHPHYCCDKYKAYGDSLEEEVKNRIAGVEKRLLEQQDAYKAHIAQREKEMKEELEKKKKEYEQMIADNLITHDEATKKLRKKEESQNTEKDQMEKMMRDMVADMKVKLDKAKLDAMSTAKKEVVEGGFVHGLGQIACGVANVVAAPVKTITGWLWGSRS